MGRPAAVWAQSNITKGWFRAHLFPSCLVGLNMVSKGCQTSLACVGPIDCCEGNLCNSAALTGPSIILLLVSTTIIKLLLWSSSGEYVVLSMLLFFSLSVKLLSSSLYKEVLDQDKHNIPQDEICIPFSLFLQPTTALLGIPDLNKINKEWQNTTLNMTKHEKIINIFIWWTWGCTNKQTYCKWDIILPIINKYYYKKIHLSPGQWLL